MPRAASPTALLGHPLLTTGGLFAEASAALSQRAERQLAADTGLSLQWFDVLIRLVRTPCHRLRMTDLSAQTTLTASGLTRAVDRLVAAGLVERQACPTDRRSTYAVLTEEGERRILAALPQHLALQEELFGGLSAEELETLAALLRRLRDATNPCAAQASTPEGLGDGPPPTGS